MNFGTWLDAMIAPETRRQAAARLGISETGISRQVRTGFSAERVIELCRAYGRNPIQGLYETGYLTRTELNRLRNTPDMDIITALKSATNDDLLDELGRRLDETIAALEEDTNIYPIGLDYTETQYVADSDSPDNDGENTDY